MDGLGKEGPGKLFDDWPEIYDQWFETPIGSLVKKYEAQLIGEFLNPMAGERILDAGCGTGVFTLEILSTGARVFGLDISIPMIQRARRKARGLPFWVLGGDLLNLPFPHESFDKTLSVTALEFIADGRRAIAELFRVTRRGGIIVVATLNRLSPWAERRKARSHPIFDQAIFRSPAELLELAPVPGSTGTAIHFGKEEDPHRAPEIEAEGQRNHRSTGAFVAARWKKP
jgi:SAM-dependent methyltransferase